MLCMVVRQNGDLPILKTDFGLPPNLVREEHWQAPAQIKVVRALTVLECGQVAFARLVKEPHYPWDIVAQGCIDGAS